MGSSPTPGALLADSTTYLKYQKEQNKNIQLKDTSSVITPIQGQIVKDELKEKNLLIRKVKNEIIIPYKVIY